MNEIIENKIPTRKDILDFQNEVAKLPQFEGMIKKDYFANGMYCREVWRPAGVVIAGKIHIHEHFFMVTKGKINVWSENGEMKTFCAGDIMVSKPNAKRITYSLEDSTVVTIHRTDKTDLDEIEKEIIEEEKCSLFILQSIF